MVINIYTAGAQKLSSYYISRVTRILDPHEQTSEFVNSIEDATGTHYAGNFEYLFKIEGTEETVYSDRISNPEGYYQDENFYYYCRDHLGNNREVWQAPVFGTGAGEVVQITNYYPYGLPWVYEQMHNPDLQPYKYNGKEFVEENGYDVYDYGFRGYYAAIGRFTQIDPMAEKYYSWSPYAYCGNNPIMRTDPTGMDFDPENEEKAQQREQTIQTRINTLETQMNDNLTNGVDNTDLCARETELRQSLSDISDMRNDHSKMYQFKNGRTNITKKTGVDKQGREIITMYSRYRYNPDKDDAWHTDMYMNIRLHEIRHGGQIARGILQVNKKGEPVGDWSLDVEVSAYRAQYSWQGILRYNPSKTGVESILKNNINGINRNFVYNLYDSWQGNQPVYLYKGLGFK